MKNDSKDKRKEDLGYHILLDVHGCKKNLKIEPITAADEDPEQISILETVITEKGLTVLDVGLHRFDNGAWTAFFMLEESHVSVHTWPDEKTVHCDIFVCNYTRNNSSAARAISTFLQEFFECTEFESRAINREG